MTKEPEFIELYKDIPRITLFLFWAEYMEKDLIKEGLGPLSALDAVIKDGLVKNNFFQEGKES